MAVPSALAAVHVSADTYDSAFTQAEDLDGLLGTLGKKAMLFEYQGEYALVEEMEKLYVYTVEEAERREDKVLGRST